MSEPLSGRIERVMDSICNYPSYPIPVLDGCALPLGHSGAHVGGVAHADEIERLRARIAELESAGDHRYNQGFVEGHRAGLARGADA